MPNPAMTVAPHRHPTPLSRGTHLGRIARRLVVADIVLVESDYPPNLKLPAHEHQEGYYCFVMNGRLREEKDRTAYLLERNSMLFRTAGEIHRQEYGPEGARCFAVSLPPAWHARYGVPPIFPHDGCDRRKLRTTLLARRLNEESRLADAVSPFAIEAIALELLTESLEGDTRSVPRWLPSACECLDEGMTASLRIGTVAQRLDLDPAYFARAFRAALGYGPGDYVRRRRLERARRLVVSTDRALGRIAIDAGFCDQSHFSRSFAHAFGVAPSTYRRRDS